jgi:tyrosine-protein kinase Etk/Wzc
MNNQHTPTVNSDIDPWPISENSALAYSVKAINLVTQLVSHKKLLTLATFIAAIAGAVYSLLLPPQFTATARFITPQQSQSSLLLFSGSLANLDTSSLASAASEELGLTSPSKLHIALLTSRPVEDALIQQFQLMNVYHSKDINAARKTLAGNTQIVSEKSSIIALSATANNKKLAADLANAYIEQYKVFYKSLAASEASQRKIFYEEQIKQAKGELDTTESDLRKLQDKKGLIQPDTQAKALVDGIASLNAQIAAKQVELRAQQSYSTSRNPSVQLTENQIASLKAEVSKLEERKVNSSAGTINLRDLADEGSEYLRIENALKYRQTLYDLLIQQYDVARLDEAKEAITIQIVESALPPQTRSAPHRTRIVLIFALFGFLIACCYLYIRKFITHNPAIRTSLKNLRAELTRI